MKLQGPTRSETIATKSRRAGIAGAPLKHQGTARRSLPSRVASADSLDRSGDQRLVVDLADQGSNPAVRFVPSLEAELEVVVGEGLSEDSDWLLLGEDFWRALAVRGQGDGLDSFPDKTLHEC